MGIYPYTSFLNGFEITDSQYNLLKDLIDNKYIHRFTLVDHYEQESRTSIKNIVVISEYSDTVNLPDKSCYISKTIITKSELIDLLGDSQEIDLKILRTKLFELSEPRLDITKYNECELFRINPLSLYGGGYQISQNDLRCIQTSKEIKLTNSPEFELVLDLIRSKNITIPDTNNMYLNIGVWTSW
jgi:hypothetical protein